MSAQIKHFLSASLTGIGNQPQTVHSIAQHSMMHSEPMRTDFSNLFNSNSSVGSSAGPNASALAIAAAKARDLLRNKNLTESMKTGNGNSLHSNGSSRDGEIVITTGDGTLPN